jgi:hypothetical protein
MVSKELDLRQIGSGTVWLGREKIDISFRRGWRLYLSVYT